MKRAPLLALLIGATACVDVERVPCPAAPAAPVRHSELEVVGPAGLDRVALETLMKHARETGSDAIVVLRDGKIAVEEYFAAGKKPIMAMSATKSVTSLAIGALRLEDPSFSLDAPIAELFPKQTIEPAKRGITTRQLMSHTSGVDVDRAKWWEGEGIGDHFWAAPMRSEPGTDFRYNNQAVDFLSVVVYAKTGERLDDWLQEKVFGPVGVRGAHWMKDPWGNPLAAGEIAMEPLELAKLGQLMLQDGVWEGRRVLAPGFVAEVTKPSQTFAETCGLLWWLDAKRNAVLTEELLARYRAVGVPDAIVDKLRALVGRRFPSMDALITERSRILDSGENAELRAKLFAQRVENGRIQLAGPVRAWEARGWIGQRIVIVPSAKLVAVRMREGTKEDQADSGPHEYPGFAKDVRALAGDREE